jgi:hypothetical protein
VALWPARFSGGRDTTGALAAAAGRTGDGFFLNQEKVPDEDGLDLAFVA